MSSTAEFDVSTHGNLIKVRLRGVWTIQIDIEYLTELTRQMQHVKGAPWAMLVDMRGWVMPQAVTDYKLEFRHSLERRNQKAECWIVDTPNQGDHLVHYFEEAKVPLARHTVEQQALDWLASMGFNG